MTKMSCFLCENQLGFTCFDVQKTVTPHSKISLLLLLEQIVGDKFLTNSYRICIACCQFLNELDVIKRRVQEIEEKFRNYVQKYVKKKQSDTEECGVCFTQIPNQDFKEHLKKHCTSLDLEQNNIKLDNVQVLAEKGQQYNQNELNGKKPLKPHKCPQCSKTWKTGTELKNHMLSHSKEKPFICEICGQAYKRQQALTIHVGMHKGVNPFTCVYCKKAFTQKGALVRHMPIHTGELPFQCDLCGKRFVHHSSFNVHKLSHTGQKSYKCDVCDALLMSSSHLKRHKRVHTGEKRFSCSVCGKKFAENYNLAVHEKLHQGESKKRKYKCQICDNVCNGQVKLKEHLHNVHQKIQSPIEQNMHEFK